jgi:hypothetical protein
MDAMVPVHDEATVDAKCIPACKKSSCVTDMNSR